MTFPLIIFSGNVIVYRNPANFNSHVYRFSFLLLCIDAEPVFPVEHAIYYMRKTTSQIYVSGMRHVEQPLQPNVKFPHKVTSAPAGRISEKVRFLLQFCWKAIVVKTLSLD